MDLRQRVKDGAGGFFELDRASDIQRAGQDLFPAVQVTELHQDLAERCQRHRQAAPRTQRLMQGHTALGEGERLVVVVAHERHVRLVVDDAGQHVVGLDGLREPLTLAKRTRGLVGSAGLREQDG